ncbi:MAG: hypothetical protein EP330_09400 [Deltaproteobacteria bacterium]|nr:MAG: hypothetical protein EP330_09400 [Deltaproteobacteria bacterium]
MKAPVPGGGLLHPVPLAGLALMVANDHWWRWSWPGVVTGKLSDVGVMLFFPLFLQGVVELFQSRPLQPSRRVLLGATAFTAVGFTLLQLWPAFANAYAWGVGALQFPLWWALDRWTEVRPVAVTMDPSDILTVPVAGLALWAGWSRCEGPTPR